MHRPYPTQCNNAEAQTEPEAGPSRASQPKKRRRLQFSSQLRNNPIQRYNADGTETVEYLHQQSTLRLKRKWESIMERFKHAHLEEQDEIYLGNRANGEPIVVLKDRGSLRGLRQKMEFGVFITDEELQGWKHRPEAQVGEAVKHDEEGGGGEDDFDPSRQPPGSSSRGLVEMSSSEAEDDTEDAAANDPDLREFLQAEALRKAMLGDVDQDDEQVDVFPFSDPGWNHIAPQHPAPPDVSVQMVRATHASPTPEPPCLVSDLESSSESSSEDETDTDRVSTLDSEEEFLDTIRTKRQNIQDLLVCTTPFETLPYNDIFGLADLLQIRDKASRLYIDLVSEDDDDDDGDDNYGDEEPVQVCLQPPPAVKPDSTPLTPPHSHNNSHPVRLDSTPTKPSPSQPALHMVRTPPKRSQMEQLVQLVQMVRAKSTPSKTDRQHNISPLVWMEETTSDAYECFEASVSVGSIATPSRATCTPTQPERKVQSEEEEEEEEAEEEEGEEEEGSQMEQLVQMVQMVRANSTPCKTNRQNNTWPAVETVKTPWNASAGDTASERKCTPKPVTRRVQPNSELEKEEEELRSGGAERTPSKAYGGEKRSQMERLEQMVQAKSTPCKTNRQNNPPTRVETVKTASNASPRVKAAKEMRRNTTPSKAASSRATSTPTRRKRRVNPNLEQDEVVLRCGGPERCTKTFCLYCVSASRG